MIKYAFIVLSILISIIGTKAFIEKDELILSRALAGRNVNLCLTIELDWLKYDCISNVVHNIKKSCEGYADVKKCIDQENLPKDIEIYNKVTDQALFIAGQFLFIIFFTKILLFLKAKIEF